MTQYSCNKCSSKNVGIETKGNQVGLYCLDCGAWIKWCNKDEVRLFSNKQHNRDNEDDNLLDKLMFQAGVIKSLCIRYWKGY